MKHCRKCLLPAAAPGANIDAAGVCEPCRAHVGSAAEAEFARRRREEDLEAALRDCRGVGEYDCLVAFSGGKDSVFLLHKLRHEYGLRVLAYTSAFDIPDVARENIRRTLERLGIDHLQNTPSEAFYRTFIRHLLRNQDEHGAVHTVCCFWVDIREGELLRVAVEKRIPLVLVGYSPGQPEPERLLYEMPRRRIAEEDWTPEHLFHSGVLDERDRDRFWNPRRFPPGTGFPRLLAPFHAWPYDQRLIMRGVVELGLVPSRSHANPVLSNFTLNWLFMYADLRSLGYNPYLPEFAALIREGKASLRLWRALVPIVNLMIRRQVLLGRNVKRWLRWLDLLPDELGTPSRPNLREVPRVGSRVA